MRELTLERIGVPKEFIKSDLIRTSRFMEPRFQWQAFHREIAAALMDASITRLIITLPPQHYKSTLACIFYPLWKLGNDPDRSIVVASYSGVLAERHSYEAMTRFQEAKYRDMFGLSLDRFVCNKGHWKIAGRRGSYSAVGIGGSLTGTPADDMIIDDYYANLKEAKSETIRRGVEDWYKTVARTRLQSEQSRIIIIATRWDEYDLIGMLLKASADNTDKWKVLVYPAFSEYAEGDFFSGKPLMKTTAFYRDQIGLDAMSPIEFETMFMCNPVPRGDIMLDPNEVEIIDRLPDGPLGVRIRGWDIAYTGSIGSDDSANALLVRAGQEVIIADADSWVAPWNVTKERIIKRLLDDDPGVMQAFETNGGQEALVDDLRHLPELSRRPIFSYTSKETKQIRALPWMLRVKGKQIKMLRGPWNEKFLNQCAHFRANAPARYDGLIDAVSKAWEGIENMVDLGAWLRGKPTNGSPGPASTLARQRTN